MMRWLVAGLLIPALAAATGFFPEGLGMQDRDRLEAFDHVREEAVAAALAGGEPDDVETLRGILEGESRAAAPDELAGAWRCRTIKLGGLRPLTIYRDFSCRITDGPEGLRIQKLTGSQRLAGTLYHIGGARFGYAGALSVGDAAPIAYGEDEERDHAGYLVSLTDGRLRLELPLPRYESRFDILELRR